MSVNLNWNWLRSTLTVGNIHLVSTRWNFLRWHLSFPKRARIEHSFEIALLRRYLESKFCQEQMQFFLRIIHSAEDASVVSLLGHFPYKSRLLHVSRTDKSYKLEAFVIQVRTSRCRPMVDFPTVARLGLARNAFVGWKKHKIWASVWLQQPYSAQAEWRSERRCGRDDILVPNWTSLTAIYSICLICLMVAFSIDEMNRSGKRNNKHSPPYPSECVRLLSILN